MRIRHKLAASGVTVAAVISAVAVSGGAANAAPFPNTEIGVHGSSHCLDNATEINSVLQMWSCTGGNEQQWTEAFDMTNENFAIINFNTGWCITAPPSSAGRVEMEPCPGSISQISESQKWTRLATGTDASGSWTQWQNVSSKLCLDTPSVANRTLLQAEPCDLGISYQKFSER